MDLYTGTYRDTGDCYSRLWWRALSHNPDIYTVSDFLRT